MVMKHPMGMKSIPTGQFSQAGPNVGKHGVTDLAGALASSHAWGTPQVSAGASLPCFLLFRHQHSLLSPAGFQCHPIHIILLIKTSPGQIFIEAWETNVHEDANYLDTISDVVLFKGNSPSKLCFPFHFSRENQLGNGALSTPSDPDATTYTQIAGSLE